MMFDMNAIIDPCIDLIAARGHENENHFSHARSRCESKNRNFRLCTNKEGGVRWPRWWKTGASSGAQTLQTPGGSPAGCGEMS